MNAKQFFAGVLANALYRIQNVTGGKCGGFGLYSRLWRIYTNEYRINRSGYVIRDMRS